MASQRASGESLHTAGFALPQALHKGGRAKQPERRAHLVGGVATVNVRTQEAIEVLAVCLYREEKLTLESRSVGAPRGRR